jgi:hypothetical protein
VVLSAEEGCVQFYSLEFLKQVPLDGLPLSYGFYVFDIRQQNSASLTKHLSEADR